MGKERENFPIADYKGIEIKTNTELHGRPFITLFSATPDGKHIFQTQILLKKYGTKYDDFPMFNKFYVRLSATTFTKTNNFYMKIKINYKEKRIILEVYDKYLNLIDNDCFWDFDTIEKRLSNKIKYLAYVTAKRKYENHKVYFFYKDIKFYELKGLDEFLNLIEKGVIKICFKVGVYKKGRKLGNIYDDGTGFEISKKDLSKLYKRINY